MDNGGGGADAIRSFGRRRGRKLRPQRQDLLRDRLPILRVTGAKGPLAPGDGFRPEALFPGPVRSVWLEIGFGGGEHLACQAAANPDVGFIGCEPFVNGVSTLLAEIERRGLANIRIHDDDARPLLAALAEGAIGRCFILFPDPWPKARHHKRRLIARPTLDALARVLADGAELRVATDDPAYLTAILAEIRAHPAFEWIVAGPSDWRARPPDWPATRYELKARAANRSPTFLRFRRRARRSGEAPPPPGIT
jgi:tRNA (guanine-N7-)-methyltransferase